MQDAFGTLRLGQICGQFHIVRNVIAPVACLLLTVFPGCQRQGLVLPVPFPAEPLPGQLRMLQNFLSRPGRNFRIIHFDRDDSITGRSSMTGDGAGQPEPYDTPILQGDLGFMHIHPCPSQDAHGHPVMVRRSRVNLTTGAHHGKTHRLRWKVNRFFLNQQLQGNQLRNMDQTPVVLLTRVMSKVRPQGFCTWQGLNRFPRIDRLQATSTGRADAVTPQTRLLPLQTTDVCCLVFLARDSPRHQRGTSIHPFGRMLLVCLHVLGRLYVSPMIHGYSPQDHQRSNRICQLPNVLNCVSCD